MFEIDDKIKELIVFIRKQTGINNINKLIDIIETRLNNFICNNNGILS